MSKKGIDVNFMRLQDIINKHEATWADGQTTFLAHVADLYNTNLPQNEDKISAATITNRWRDGHVKINVKKGQRGRQPGEKLSTAQKVAMQSARGAGKKPFNKEGITELENRKGVPTWAKNLIRKAKLNPTRKNRMNLKCAECVGMWEQKDIKFCTIQSCPNWDLRPYQGSKIEEE